MERPNLPLTLFAPPLPLLLHLDDPAALTVRRTHASAPSALPLSLSSGAPRPVNLRSECGGRRFLPSNIGSSAPLEQTRSGVSWCAGDGAALIGAGRVPILLGRTCFFAEQRGDRSRDWREAQSRGTKGTACSCTSATPNLTLLAEPNSRLRLSNDPAGLTPVVSCPQLPSPLPPAQSSTPSSQIFQGLSPVATLAATPQLLASPAPPRLAPPIVSHHSPIFRNGRHGRGDRV